jgi:sulfur-oxidizing protein SoxA
MNSLRYLTLTLGVLLVAWTTLSAEPKSGYEYLKPESQRLQDDDFENPGLLAVENGEFLFNQQDKVSGKSCIDCHGVSGRSSIQNGLHDTR